MSASILQRVLRCLLWLGLGTLGLHAIDAQAIDAQAIAAQGSTWSDSSALNLPADRNAGTEAGHGIAAQDRGPVPQDRGEGSDPAKRRHVSRKLQSNAVAVAGSVQPDATPAWRVHSVVATGVVATCTLSAATPRPCRMQRSTLHRRQLRAQRGRAPPDAAATS